MDGVDDSTGIEVHAAVIANGVGLQEAAKSGGIDARLEVVEASVAKPGLAGIAKAAHGSHARYPIRPIASDAERVATAIADGDDRAALVGMQPAPCAGAAAFIPDQHFIHRRPRHIAPQQCSGAAVFRHQRIAIVKQLVGAAAAAGLIEPPQRIIGKAQAAATRDAGQPVFHIIRIAVAAVRGQIATRIMGERRGAGRRQLVNITAPPLSCIPLEPRLSTSQSQIEAMLDL